MKLLYCSRFRRKTHKILDLELLTFILYVFIAANTTIFVGQTLYNNGYFFLERIFRSVPHLVHPINKLLLLGFYLVNLGFVLVFFTLKTEANTSLLQCLEFLSVKLGIVYLILGAMHLFNLTVFILVEKHLTKKSNFLQHEVFK